MEKGEVGVRELPGERGGGEEEGADEGGRRGMWTGMAMARPWPYTLAYNTRLYPRLDTHGHRVSHLTIHPPAWPQPSAPA